MSNATSALTALATKLAAICETRVGRAALETTSATLPVITLLSQGDQAGNDQNYGVLLYTRRVIVEYKAQATDTYHSSMDDALVALRAKIVQDTDGTWLSGYAMDVRETQAAFLHPDVGGDCFVIQLTLELDYY